MTETNPNEMMSSTNETVTVDTLIEPEKISEYSTIPVSSQLLVLATLLLFIFGIGFVPHLMRNHNPTTPSELILSEANLPAAVSDNLNSATNPFQALSLDADAAFVYDVTTAEVLYAKEPDTVLPLASLTKLMTALLAYELAHTNTDVAISVEALLQYGNDGLRDGEKFSLVDLIDFTLMTSSNDGAFALAEVIGTSLDSDRPAAAFVQAMNVRATEIGLLNTSFRNPTGLDISDTEGGAYGTSRDLAILMTHILREHPIILERTTMRLAPIESTTGVHQSANTNQDVSNIPGIIGSKTGFTSLAGGNLVIAFDAGLNRPVVAVVLGSSWTGRFSDVERLAEAAQTAILQ